MKIIMPRQSASELETIFTPSTHLRWYGYSPTKELSLLVYKMSSNKCCKDDKERSLMHGQYNIPIAMTWTSLVLRYSKNPIQVLQYFSSSLKVLD